MNTLWSLRLKLAKIESIYLVFAAQLVLIIPIRRHCWPLGSCNFKAGNGIKCQKLKYGQNMSKLTENIFKWSLWVKLLFQVKLSDEFSSLCVQNSKTIMPGVEIFDSSDQQRQEEWKKYRKWRRSASATKTQTERKRGSSHRCLDVPITNLGFDQTMQSLRL